MQTIEPDVLRAAVSAICPDVASRTAYHGMETNERALWRELSTCLLSSQVPYELAVAAADSIDRSEILLDPSITDLGMTASVIEDILRSPLEVGTRQRSYRFYASKSLQLARTCHAVRRDGKSLVELVRGFDDAATARTWFIQHAPGIGPKQASMFLRNVGFTYELAVLDRHVLSYMTALKIDTPKATGDLKWYYRREHALRRHADDLGYPVGLMDWAIWIVMRVARKNSMVLP